ncbi:Lsr2 family protein [Natronosporangium hydrolyticum]|uniref:Lsr2 family protein n=1 Tax=Natronosporangium hydrolyticum TaxID=2811111 RepID=A0A895YG51_9ACTN|nr:Lsr2 family protein [Natronosporangium hydrolyticum]
MAKQTITKLIDDLDKGEADETVKFGLDGVLYEIDLSSKNAAKLRDALGPYVKAGTRVRVATATAPPRRRGGVPATTDRAQNKAIREWAKSKNRKISDRGRIPEEIVAEYHASAGR